LKRVDHKRIANGKRREGRMHKRTGVPIRISLADDSAILRKALKAILSMFPGMEIVGEAGDGLEAVQLVEAAAPDVLVIDHRMPLLTGLAAIQIIKSKFPTTKTILLTMDEHMAAQAVQAGASKGIVKGGSFKEIIAAIVGQPEEVAAPA
jgi:DNA-binding NarL/FixJ family response regulator